IGSTIRTALEDASTLADIKENVKGNMERLSNGCLMRIWSLLYYYYSKTDNEMVNAVIDDCNLTHPNKECIKCCVLYCRILKTALNGGKKGDIINILVDAKNTNS